MVITVLSLHGNIYVVKQTRKNIFLSSQHHKIYHAVSYLIQLIPVGYKFRFMVWIL